MFHRHYVIRDCMSAGTVKSVSRSGADRAFTLIEVLVVVAIIALLVSILIPAFVSARDSTRLVVCQSNQKQLTMAWYGYFSECRVFPRGYWISTTFGGKQGRADHHGGPADATDCPRLLNRYLKLPAVIGAYPHGLPPDKQSEAQPQRIPDAANIFQCPGDTGPTISTQRVNPFEETPLIYSTFFDYYGTSYRTNRLVIGRIPPMPFDTDPCKELIQELRARWVNYLYADINLIPHASRLMLMGDFTADMWQDPAELSPPQEFHNRALRNRDFKDGTGWCFYNVAFLDGHVALTGINKGVYVCAAYSMIPFRDLQQRFAEEQRSGYVLPPR